MRNLIPLYLFLALSPLAYAQSDADILGPFQFRNEVSATYDSKIEGRSDSDSDVEFVYAPTFTFTRQSGLLGVDASLGGAFGFFADHSEYNYEDFSGGVSLTYPNTPELPYTLTLSGGYSQTTRVDQFLGGRLQVDNLYVSGGLRYNVNERWGFRIGGRWAEVEYDLARSDQSTWGYNLGFIYRYSEKLDIVLGYGYSETSASVDTQDSTFSLQAEGELTPKLTGTLGVGFQFRETEFGDSSDPYVNISLDWALNERIEIVATGSIGFLTTSTGASGRRSSAGLAAATALRHDLSASVGVSYSDTSYDDFGLDRSDESLLFRAALVWQLSPAASLSASLTYEDSQSNRDFLNYDRLRFGLSGSYTF